MSMQSTKESGMPQRVLGENVTQKTAQQREKEEKYPLTHGTSGMPQRVDLYSLSILRKEERERVTDCKPFSFPKDQPGQSQEQEQEQTDHCDRTGLIEEPQAIRQPSIDEQYQQEQERLMQQKKSGSAPAVEEGKHDRT
jgi:hypothetical protein